MTHEIELIAELRLCDPPTLKDKEMCDRAAHLIESLSAEGQRMRRHLENTVKTMKGMGTYSGQTISTGWVLKMAESALPVIVDEKGQQP